MVDMNGKRMAYLQIAASMTIVGSSVVAGKLLVAGFPVFLASEFRFLIALALMVPLFLWKEKKLSLTRRDVLFLFLQAFTGIFLFNIFMLYGLQWTTAADSGIITSMIPAVIGIVSFLFLGEKLNRYKIAGIVLTMVGAMVINAGHGGSAAAPGSNPLLGNTLVFGAVVGEACYFIFGKALTGRITPIANSMMMCVFGVLLFLPFTIAEAMSFPFSSASPLDWTLIAYNAVFVTVIAFILSFRGLAKVSASAAGVMTGMLPVSAVVLSYIVLGESFRWSHLIGMLCVLLAIGLISKEPRAKTAELRRSLGG